MYMGLKKEKHIANKSVRFKHLLKTTNSLKNKYSAGHDGTSGKFLKTVAPTIINPLTLMINQFLATGIFPDSLKITLGQGTIKHNFIDILITI